MPKIVKELTAIEVSRLRHGAVKGTKVSKRKVGEPITAYHAVGGVQGLILQCKPPVSDQAIGARSWILRVSVAGKRREIGLGSYPGVTLAMAKEKARVIKEQIAEGLDPIVEKKAKKSALIQERARAITFDKVAEDYLEKKSAEFKSVKQKQQLLGRLNNYILPSLGNIVIADIELSDVEAVLKPIWNEKNETAGRVRRDIEKVIDLAIAKGIRVTSNPARWKGLLDQVLAAPSALSDDTNYPALPVTKLPSFWEQLCGVDTIGSLALQFQILTAARSGAVRFSTWDEFDLEQKLWTIQPKRKSAKVKKEHKVPLCEKAISILTSLPRQCDYPFSSNGSEPISDATMGAMIRRLHKKQKELDSEGYVDPKQENKVVVPHGFRSTFKDWSLEYTTYADEITELALSHVNSDKTRRAYARSQMIDKRRVLMNDWQEYCLSGQ